MLLVDDEDLVRAGTAEMLRDIGHEVHEATGGAQALAMLAGGLEVDAVVTDYMMPRMNGAELAERISSSAIPSLPVLIVTGYAGGDLELQIPQLAKPFRQADLAAALNRLIAPADRKVAAVQADQLAGAFVQHGEEGEGRKPVLARIIAAEVGQGGREVRLGQAVQQGLRRHAAPGCAGSSGAPRPG